MAIPYDGEVVMLTKPAHQRLKRDKDRAEQRVKFEEEAAEHARQWARDCLAEERRLSERCTYLYGLAASLGATPEQLNPKEGT